MAFDVDQHHATVCPPWSFTRDGQRYVARHVSAPAVERFLTGFNAAETDAAKDKELTKLLRIAFPPKLSYRWRRLEDPVHQLLTLDVLTRKAALADFFAYLGIQMTTSGPQASQTASMPSEGASVAAVGEVTGSRS